MWTQQMPAIAYSPGGEGPDKTPKRDLLQPQLLFSGIIIFYHQPKRMFC